MGLLFDNIFPFWNKQNKTKTKNYKNRNFIYYFIAQHCNLSLKHISWPNTKTFTHFKKPRLHSHYAVLWAVIINLNAIGVHVYQIAISIVKNKTDYFNSG